MEDVTLQPVYDQTNDYISNYTTGNIDNTNRLRAINRAFEDCHRRLGLQADETIFSFLYSQDNMYTDLPTDFDEPIALVYQNPQNNRPETKWNWQPYPYILQNNNQRYSFQKSFGTTNINGKKQLIQIGTNLWQGSIINAFNSTNLVTAVGDAIDLAVDNNVWIANGGSLSFTIDPTLGFGYGGIQVTGFGVMTVEQAIKQSGIYKVWSWLPSTDISEITLKLESSPGNYFLFSASAQDSSLPFVANAWNRTQYPWNLVSIVGSPNSKEINLYEFDYIEGPGFGTVPIPLFRIDDFFLVFPDLMNLIFYSQYKGTSNDGLTKKKMLTDVSDKPYFMSYFPDLLNPIALRAAYILMPQLSGDKEFMKMYRDDYLEQLKVWGKIYPRKRCVNIGQTSLQRP